MNASEDYDLMAMATTALAAVATATTTILVIIITYKLGKYTMCRHGVVCFARQSVSK